MKKIVWFWHMHIHKLSDKTLAKFDIFTDL